MVFPTQQSSPLSQHLTRESNGTSSDCGGAGLGNGMVLLA